MTLSARNWAWDLRYVSDANGARIRELKPGEKLTLLCIAEHENAEYGYAYPSYEVIGERTCQSVRTVQSHVRALVELGAFTIERRKSRKGKWMNNVYVLDVPELYRMRDPEWQRRCEQYGERGFSATA